MSYASVQAGADKIANIYVGADRVWTQPEAATPGGGGGAVVGPVPGLVGVIGDYDASQLEGYAEDEIITSWPDVSGNENHLPWITGDPKYQAAGIAGLPAVRMTSDRIRGNGLGVIQPATVIMVVRVDSALSSYANLLSGPTGDMAVYNDSSSLSVSAGAAAVWTSSAPLSSPALLSVRFDGASTLARLNGAETALTGVGTGGLTDLYLGLNASSAGGWTGAYGRVIVAGPQTNEQLNEAEAALATTYGITLA